MMEQKRPNRGSNPSLYYRRNKNKKRGKFIFIRSKKRETKELLKAVLP